jgi:YjbE family integral membrane protein
MANGAMSVLMDAEFWGRLAGIVLIDLTLAGDNALVIALAVRGLPPRQQLLGRLWGTAGAVGMRLAFIAVATWLLALPFVQLAGGVLLVWIAVKLVLMKDSHGESVREGASVREAIWIVMVADAVMSLDNVLAVAATAHGDVLLVVLGIGLSLPLVVWGSGLLARLMSHWPAIIWLGGGVLGWVAGEMIVRELVQRGLEAGGWSEAAPAGPAAVIAALGWWAQRRRASRVRV